MSERASRGYSNRIPQEPKEFDDGINWEQFRRRCEDWLYNRDEVHRRYRDQKASDKATTEPKRRRIAQ